MVKKRTSRVVMTDEARVLRSMRISKGLSMRKAGELIGVSDSYISQIENGRMDPPIEPRLDEFLAVYGPIKTASYREKVRLHKAEKSEAQIANELLARIPKEKLSTVISFFSALLS